MSMNVHAKPFYVHENQCMQILNLSSLVLCLLQCFCMQCFFIWFSDFIYVTYFLVGHPPLHVTFSVCLTVCPPGTIFQEPYIMWSLFLVHMCKMLSLGVFFILKKIWHPSHIVSYTVNSESYHHDFCYICVK